MGDFGWVDAAGVGAGVVRPELVVYEAGGCSEEEMEVSEGGGAERCCHCHCHCH